MPAGTGDAWADLYDRARPGWPEAAIDAAGVGAGATVLDLGAGTGKLTRLLVLRFTRVIAVEPADAMRRLLVARLPQVEALAGTGQELPLADASVDAVFAAQAFHWVDDERAVAEIARVLRPRGTLVVLWNHPAGSSWEPRVDDVEQRLLRLSPHETAYDPLDLGARLLPWAVAGFEPLEERRLPNPQTLDRDGLVTFYATMGWIADLPDPERLPLLEQVRSALTATSYRRTWETVVQWARRD
jgi:SAM-dependent methyltransferase